MADVVECQFKYKAFISYSHRDDEWASWLLKALERYRIPDHIRQKHPRAPLPKRLGRFFRDRDELPATGHMTDRIFEALAESEYLIVVCSPDAVRSKLVNREIAEFKRVRGEGHVLCVIVGGVPFADSHAEECFPEALRLQFTSDGTHAGVSAENLAADAREEGDGRRHAILKLVAGMLGIGLNDLVRRETQFRQRRVGAVAIAATVGMATMAALAFEAHRAREQAEQALYLAEVKQREASATAAQIEELTIFIMSSVYDELITAGSLSVLERTSKKIVDQLNSIGLENMSTSQTMQLVGAYLRLGQALERKGESSRAREYFSTAQTWARDLFRRHPNDPAAVGGLQTSLFFTGYLSRRQGDYKSAEADFLERSRLTTIALETKLGSANLYRPEYIGHWEEEVADAEAHLCDVQIISLGKPHEALERCKRSVALRRMVVELQPALRENWINLASSYFFLAKSYLALNRNVEAKEALLSRHAVYANILAEEPKNYRVLRRAVMTRQMQAEIEVKQGNDEKALRLLTEAREGFDVLTSQDPSNVMWLADSSSVYADIAQLLLNLGDTQAAGEALGVAEEQISTALASDMSRTSRRLNAHQIRLLKAQFALETGDSERATTFLREAVAHFEGEDTAYLLVPGALEFASRLYLTKGDFLARAGDTEAATAAWQHVVALYETSTVTKTRPLRETVAAAYRNLGQAEMAVALMNNGRAGR